MMNQRVDQLRKFLDLILLDEAELAQRKKCIMDELLNTRRQITRADRLKVELGFFLENCPDKASFEKELAKIMATLSVGNSDSVVRQIDGVYMATWMGHPIT